MSVDLADTTPDTDMGVPSTNQAPMSNDTIINSAIEILKTAMADSGDDPEATEQLNMALNNYQGSKVEDMSGDFEPMGPDMVDGVPSYTEDELSIDSYGQSDEFNVDDESYIDDTAEYDDDFNIDDESEMAEGLTDIFSKKKVVTEPTGDEGTWEQAYNFIENLDDEASIDDVNRVVNQYAETFHVDGPHDLDFFKRLGEQIGNSTTIGMKTVDFLNAIINQSGLDQEVPMDESIF